MFNHFGTLTSWIGWSEGEETIMLKANPYHHRFDALPPIEETRPSIEPAPDICGPQRAPLGTNTDDKHEDTLQYFFDIGAAVPLISCRMLFKDSS